MALTLVSTVTVGSGGAASIEFTNIPQTGKDLLILNSFRATGTSDFAVRIIDASFNNSTANFTGRSLIGYGTTGTVFSENYTNLIDATGDTGVTANTFSSASVYISNYAGSSNKSISIDTVRENNSAVAYLSNQAIIASQWANSSAITSIKMTPQASQSFVQHSTSSLYIIS